MFCCRISQLFEDHPITPAQLSHLIGLIYQCALEPELWPRTMDEICKELDFRTGVISVISLPDGKPLIAAATGFEEPWLEKVLLQSEQLVDLWGGDAVIRSLPLDEPAVLSSVNPSAIAESSGHPFHESFNKPQGFVDALAIGLTRDPHSIGTIGFNRHMDAGLVGPREIEIMQLLIPHLQRAATISRVLDARSIATRQLETVLSGLTFPVAVISDALTIGFANPALTDMLEMPDRNFDVVNGQLRLRFAPAHAMLLATLHDAASDGHIQGRAAFGIPIGAPGERVQSLHILPLDGKAGSQFAVFLTPHSAALENTGNTIASLFGLTQAEQRVFEQIAAGRSVEQASDELGVAVSTIRTHLLRIFAKTGAARQAELVTLAAAFRPMVRP